MSRLEFNQYEFGRLIDGAKRLTIRRGIRHITPGPTLATHGTCIAVVQVEEVSVRYYSSLTLVHATQEGLLTLFDLRTKLEAIYPGIMPEDYITLVYLGKVEWWG